MIKNKRGQESGVGMSFGFLFSIILIAIFVFVAIWGINFFLDVNTCSQIGSSLDELQREISNAYKSSYATKEITLNFPGVEKICFANLTEPITSDLRIYEEIEIYDLQDANTFLYPSAKSCDFEYKKINFINLSETIRNKNPYCIDANEPFRITFDPSTTGRGVVIR